MRKSLVGSVSVLLTGAGLTWAQPAPQPLPPLTLPTASQSAPPTAAPSGDAPPAAVGPTPAEAPGGSGPLASEMGKEGPICAPGRFFTDVEYLFWFTRPLKLPPLVLEGPPTGVPPAVGAEGTTILVGNQEIEREFRSGMRLRAGYWFDADETFGLEASGFYLTPTTYHATVVPNTTSTSSFAASYVDISGQTIPPEASVVFASPGSSTGTAQVETSTKFWGADINAAINATGSSWYRADALIGFRYLRLAEDFGMTTTSTALPDGAVLFEGDFVFPPATVVTNDSFRTTNDFYGAQVGAHILLQKGMWFADLRGLLAAGVTRETVTINGSTTLTTAGPAIGPVMIPTGTTTVPGGLYAQASNIGSHSTDQFTIIPEGIVSVGCQVTHYLRVYLGYSVLYWRDGVVRPDTEIDRQISKNGIPQLAPLPLPSEVHPAVQLQRVDFWAQGVQFGVEIAF